MRAIGCDQWSTHRDCYDQRPAGINPRQGGWRRRGPGALSITNPNFDTYTASTTVDAFEFRESGRAKSAGVPMSAPLSEAFRS